jgi:hypothetical protein
LIAVTIVWIKEALLPAVERDVVNQRPITTFC